MRTSPEFNSDIKIEVTETLDKSGFKMSAEVTSEGTKLIAAGKNGEKIATIDRNLKIEALGSNDQAVEHIRNAIKHLLPDENEEVKEENPKPKKVARKEKAKKPEKKTKGLIELTQSKIQLVDLLKPKGYFILSSTESGTNKLKVIAVGQEEPVLSLNTKKVNGKEEDEKKEIVLATPEAHQKLQEILGNQS